MRGVRTTFSPSFKPQFHNQSRSNLSKNVVSPSLRSTTQYRPSFNNRVKNSESLQQRSFCTEKKTPLWNLGKLNHVAIAVGNLTAATSLYKDILGAQVSDPVAQQEHGVTTVFVDLGNTKIELLHPLGEKSPISKFLEKKPDGGIHHICIEVDDIEAAIKDLKEKGIVPIDPKPKIGAHGKPVVFLHPKSMNGVLVELEQK